MVTNDWPKKEGSGLNAPEEEGDSLHEARTRGWRRKKHDEHLRVKMTAINA